MSVFDDLDGVRCERKRNMNSDFRYETSKTLRPHQATTLAMIVQKTRGDGDDEMVNHRQPEPIDKRIGFKSADGRLKFRSISGASVACGGGKTLILAKAAQLMMTNAPDNGEHDGNILIVVDKDTAAFQLQKAIFDLMAAKQARTGATKNDVAWQVAVLVGQVDQATRVDGKFFGPMIVIVTYPNIAFYGARSQLTRPALTAVQKERWLAVFYDEAQHAETGLRQTRLAKLRMLSTIAVSANRLGLLRDRKSKEEKRDDSDSFLGYNPVVSYTRKYLVGEKYILDVPMVTVAVHGKEVRVSENELDPNVIEFVRDFVEKALTDKRTIMVYATRQSQFSPKSPLRVALQTVWNEHVDRTPEYNESDKPLLWMFGQTKMDARIKVLQRLQRYKAGAVIMASSVLEEGWDIPDLYYVLAVMTQGPLFQLIGRAQRMSNVHSERSTIIPGDVQKFIYVATPQSQWGLASVRWSFAMETDEYGAFEVRRWVSRKVTFVDGLHEWQFDAVNENILNSHRINATRMSIWSQTDDFAYDVDGSFDINCIYSI